MRIGELEPGQWILLMNRGAVGNNCVVRVRLADTLLTGVAPDTPNATRTMINENTMP